MTRRQLLVALAILGILGAAAGIHRARRPLEPKIPPVSLEPDQPNAVLAANYRELMPEQIAVLLLGPTQEALAAARTFTPVGIPFFVTSDAAAALRHRIIFIPADDHPMRLTPELRRQFMHFVSSGGILVLQPPTGDLWPELTGLKGVSPARSRKILSFNVAADPGFAYLGEPEEAQIQLASSPTPESIWTTGLACESGAVVIARFPETSEAAMIRNSVGSGFVYTIGVDLRDVVIRPQAGRSFDAHRIPYNGFEPGADVFPLIFRSWYENYTPTWLRVRAAPGEARGMLFVSHNVAAGTHLRAAEDFSALERERGVKATYFVQTKYVLDTVKAPFFDNRVLLLIERLYANGHEIASRGVAGTPDLDAFPMGTGAETMKNYRPQAGQYEKTEGGTLLGEFHVSKTLLEERLKDEKITGFRSRLFAFPELLDTALLRAGYAYDSSLLAAASLTHFPFRMLQRRVMTRESEILEFPMTFEDEGKDETLGSPGPITATMRKIADNEGSFVWLISPTGAPANKVLLRVVLENLPAGMRPMTLADGARFWNARAKTRFWLTSNAGGKNAVLHLALPGKDADGLSFELSRNITSCRPGSMAGPGFQVRCAERILTLEKTGAAREAEVYLELQ